MSALPEVLRQGRQIIPLFVGRVLLSTLGVSPEREPPQVAFPPYGPEDAEAVLFRALCTKMLQQDVGAEAMVLPSVGDLRAVCSSGLIRFAAPYVGLSIHELLWIGEAVLATPHAFGASMATLQHRVEELIQERLGLCDLSGMLLESRGVAGQPCLRRLGTATLSAKATMEGTTKEEKRLLLAAYLGARIDKDNDTQLFMPEGRRRMRRKGAKPKQGKATDEVPVFLRTPKPVNMPRLLSIYHRLARQQQLLGPPLLEHIAGLRDAGLLRFVGDRQVSVDRDVKIICRAELPLVRMCAAELGVDLAEFLCTA